MLIQSLTSLLPGLFISIPNAELSHLHSEEADN